MSMLGMTLEAVLNDISVLTECLEKLGLVSKASFEFTLKRVLPSPSEKSKVELVERIDRLEWSLDNLKHNLSLKDGEEDGDAAKCVANDCKKCSKRFATPALLQHHMDRVHDGLKESSDDTKVPLYCCQLCYCCFRQKFQFDQHECQVKNKKRGLTLGFIQSADLLRQHNRFKCGKCLEDFRIFDRIQAHLTKCKGALTTCELCSKEYQTRKELDKHKEEEHSDELAFRCSECPKEFKLRNSLRKHVAQAHKGDSNKESSVRRRYQCEERGCGKVFIKKVYLTIHMTRFHNLAKPFLCQQCGDTFVSGSSLKSHLDIHEGSRPFTCSTCGKTFRRKDKLVLHEAIHTLERPHTCPVCNKGFISKSKLNEHMQRHTGYKRFSCQVCRKLYAGSYDLRKHLLKHHPDHSKNIKPRLPLTPQIVQLVDERMRPGGKKRGEGNKIEATNNRVDSERDLQCGDLEIDLGALNAAEVPIEELEVDASVVFLTEDGRAIQELKQV